MDKRYQIFISSTFTDLQDERAQVQNMIMKLGYIPAGMELFPAIDEEQLEFIKRIIDDSDYYLLIIGGRYGSMDKDGISYTEREYDYAVEKGMKVIALIHQNPQKLSLEKTDTGAKSRRSLERFKKKVKQGKLVLFWNNVNELPSQLAQSLPATIKSYPAVGWVRADSVPSPDVYKELNDLRKENSELRTKISQSESLEADYNIAGLSDAVSVEGWLVKPALGITEEWSFDTTWGYIFYKIAPGIQIETGEDSIIKFIARYFYRKTTGNEAQNALELKSPDKMALRIQFRALNLINISNKGGDFLWKLTSTGEKLMLIKQAKRKPIGLK